MSGAVSRNAPDYVSDIISNQQTPLTIDRYTDGSTVSSTFVIQKSSEYIERRGTRWPRPVEGHEDHPVATVRSAIPRTVLADEHSICESLWQSCTRRSSEPERGGVRPKGVVGHECARHEVGSLRLSANVQVTTEVAIRPAVETAVAHGRQVVGYEVATKLVSLVDHRP
jgi:hypothetical protein